MLLITILVQSCCSLRHVIEAKMLQQNGLFIRPLWLIVGKPMPFPTPTKMKEQPLSLRQHYAAAVAVEHLLDDSSMFSQQRAMLCIPFLLLPFLELQLSWTWLEPGAA